MHPLARFALGTATTGLAGVAYAAGYESRRWTLREVALPVLPEGSRPLRILHVSDLHLTPGQESKKRWVAELAALEPDLVVNTGDNLAHPKAVPAALTALGPLLNRPGLFVFGSNDYFGPTPKNPARYLRPSQRRIHGAPLPWRDLRAGFVEHGWQDATHQRLFLDVDGRRIGVVGVDDPHLSLDRYSSVSGPMTADLRLGLTHSPEPRVLDGMAADGVDLVLAGHTHGGQLRLPGYGAIVTNCGIDRSRARGASRWGTHTWLHVSAGMGTSPYTPVRFACPPEVSLLTLLPRPVAPARSKATPAQASETVG
ncbi:metallophosphoesterase [Pseudonocardia sp. WMMC193]|uniref:metallophosphoesterase n=1 Tax=Pseudonocardia sp. WMMC193 TaxID=2911965 RepID=UPI001F1C1089|nr:metallophosphoesterase [Pseudonocardia sp. WMMC193]MCF7551632.1 metallophosphoesterase [Pseudonocardia sp. WMMC193]